LIIGRGRDVLIADKQGIELGTAGRRGPLDHPARSLTRIFQVRVIARERDPDFHRVILVAAPASIRPELADQAKDRLRLRYCAGGILVDGALSDHSSRWVHDRSCPIPIRAQTAAYGACSSLPPILAKVASP